MSEPDTTERNEGEGATDDQASEVVERRGDDDSAGAGPDGDSEDDTRPPLTLGKKLLMSGILVVLMLPFAELVARVLQRDIEIRRRLRRGGLLKPFEPNAVGDLWRPEFRARYSINSFGYRDRERTAARTPGTKRLIVLGDSFSVGWGVPQERAYPQQLEAGLGGPEVWNCARSGNNPLFYVYQARFVIESWKPDALLVQIFDNDTLECEYFSPRFKYDGGTVGKLPTKYRINESLFEQLGDAFNGLALRRLYKGTKRRLEGETVPRHFIRPGVKLDRDIPIETADMAVKLKGADEAFEGFAGWYHEASREDWKPKFEREEQLLRQLIKECEAAGTPIALLYIPHLVNFHDSPEGRAARSGNAHRKLVARVAASTGVTFFDATPMLEEGAEPSKLYFPSDLHLNSAGHDQLAEQLLPKVRAWLETIPEKTGG